MGAWTAHDQDEARGGNMKTEMQTLEQALAEVVATRQRLDGIADQLRMTISALRVEVQLADRAKRAADDAMAKLMQQQPFHAYVYDGVTHDCGDKIGLLRANVALALKRPDLGAAARAAVEAALKA